MNLVYGDATLGRSVHRNNMSIKNKDGKVVLASADINKKLIDVSWLKLASPVYQISPDIRDYLLWKVPAVTSDIFNRNAQAFPYEELVYFNPLLGRPTYKTFIGKPVHVEHKNEDPTKAKGVIFDAVLLPVPKYKVYKVVLLVGVDRTKDPDLVRDIKKGDVAWSMGALVDVFQCSVCKANVTRRLCNCFQHVGKGGLLDNKVVYEICRGVNYIEVSVVGDPADVTAWGSLLE